MSVTAARLVCRRCRDRRGKSRADAPAGLGLMRPQGSGATHRLSVCEAHPKSTPAPTLAPPHHDTRPCGSAIARGRARLCTEIPRDADSDVGQRGNPPVRVVELARGDRRNHAIDHAIISVFRARPP